MYVIGTAGHIDHGKTMLIKALTGIDCDRLPEEKEREMTIDLGFAHMELPGLGTVGIIDVPGHERFIRNMVSGAWGIDLGLLVVAADDGWMPQTDDHFRVLKILNVPRIIAVINKSDLADKEKIDGIASFIEGMMENSGYRGADIVRVSAKTGAGIADLKSAIAKNCGMLPPPEDRNRPYLFVDRVFAVKGHGTVATGTQKNGVFRDGDTVTILPNEVEVRLKRVESHNKAVSGESSIRAAVNLSGISSDEMDRGAIVVKKNFFTRTDDFIAALAADLDEKDEKKGTGIEVLVGTADVPGRIAGKIDDRGERDRSIVRIRLDRPWYLYPGQRFVVTKTGGFRIYGGGIVLIPDYDKSRMRNAVKERSGELTEFSIENILYFNISVRGWLPVSSIAGMVPFDEKTAAEMVRKITERGNVGIIDDYAVQVDLLTQSLETLRQAITANPGLHLKEVANKADLDHEFCAVLARRLVAGGGAEEREGRYFIKVENEDAPLSGTARSILEKAIKNAVDGIELKGAVKEGEKKVMKELIGRGLLVSIDGNLLWHRKIYDDMKGRIIGMFDKKDKLSIGDAREATGLSRKYLIPLLNRMERDGAVKRSGDFRIKP